MRRGNDRVGVAYDQKTRVTDCKPAMEGVSYASDLDAAYTSAHISLGRRTSYRRRDPNRSAEPALLGLSSRRRGFSSPTGKSIRARIRGVLRISGCTPSFTVLDGSGRGGSIRINTDRRSASTRGRTAI